MRQSLCGLSCALLLLFIQSASKQKVVCSVSKNCIRKCFCVRILKWNDSFAIVLLYAFVSTDTRWNKVVYAHTYLKFRGNSTVRMNIADGVPIAVMQLASFFLRFDNA